MGLKVLGLLCAGVFFGAALLEVKQLRWRKKKKKGAKEACEACDACDACDATAKPDTPSEGD